jgi:hypothetical protein
MSAVRRLSCAGLLDGRGSWAAGALPASGMPRRSFVGSCGSNIFQGTSGAAASRPEWCAFFWICVLYLVPCYSMSACNVA